MSRGPAAALPTPPAASPSLGRQDVDANAEADADLERRFGGLRRLYGDAAYRRIRAARLVVVGLGGVGSWAAEALARSGVAALTLVDLDHVAESNINRQVQALGRTVGQAKVQALAERIADIHPGCRVHGVEDFASADNWPGLLPAGVPVDGVVDACDQGQAKLALAAWARATGTPLVVCGAAGGKCAPQQVEVADLAEVTHDPLLAGLRQRLRRVAREDAAGLARPASGDRAAALAPALAVPSATSHPGPSRSKPSARPPRLGLDCVFSREPVRLPDAGEGLACATDGSLNCHGYGSSVTVTATFGLVAAARLLQRVAGTA